MKCLIIEDDIDTAGLIGDSLKDVFHHVEVLADGYSALEKIRNTEFNLVITDVMLPGKSGFTILDEIAQAGIKTPVLMMSGLGDQESRSKGLTKGAEDYLLKPFSIAELRIRVHKILNRSMEDELILHVAGITLNRFSRQLTYIDKTVQLQDKEYALVELFMRNPGAIITKSHILKEIWKYDFDPGTNIVDVLLCRVRSRIQDHIGVRLIGTVRGVGYILKT